MEKWTKKEIATLDGLDTPPKVQEFVDGLTYSGEDVYRSPRTVLRERTACCFDGAVFAAAALQRAGYPPLLLDLQAVRDDDHVIALYRKNGHWGAVAKSHFMGLRNRMPVYRTLRELAISYFEAYYNADREMTLRRYSTPFDLDRSPVKGWRFEDSAMDTLADLLDRRKHYEILARGIVRGLDRLDPLSSRMHMIRE
jgi:hypothetical protein